MIRYVRELAYKAQQSLEGLTIGRLRSILFQDRAANPAVEGELSRNGANLFWHDGTNAVQLNLDASSLPDHTHSSTQGGQLDWDDVWTDAAHTHQSAAEGGTIDHGAALTGLTDDDHTQYPLLAGRASGQTLTGGTGSGDDLTLKSTSNATKGTVFIEEADALELVSGTSAMELRLREPSGSGTSYISFKAPALAAQVDYTLPADDGDADQVLSTNGSGVLDWVDAGAGGGDNISVNSTAATDADFDDATPAAPAGHVNVQWQIDTTTSPDSISAYVAAGWEFISSQTFTSAEATAEFDLDNANYADYLFVLENVAPATDDAVLFMRTSTDGGSTFDAGASDYSWVFTRAVVGATPGTSGDAADSELELKGSGSVGWGNAANEAGSGAVWLMTPGTAAFTFVHWHIALITPAGAFSDVIGSGQRLAAADVDAVQFLFSSGNLESGTIRLYGIRGA